MMQVGGRFTEMVGCAVPIQCAAMAGIATPELAAAVSNAGGLGMPAAGRRSDVLRAQIDATRRETHPTWRAHARRGSAELPGGGLTLSG